MILACRAAENLAKERPILYGQMERPPCQQASFYLDPTP
jgi:hypothetical protein